MCGWGERDRNGESVTHMIVKELGTAVNHWVQSIKGVLEDDGAPQNSPPSLEGGRTGYMSPRLS